MRDKIGIQKQSYPGGKGADGVYHQIINQIPPHSTFMELFFGGGSITKKKKPAARTIGMDINRGVIQAAKANIKMPGLRLMVGDASEFLINYKWRGGEFVYLDPPYLLDTRRSKSAIYEDEFSNFEQHAALLDLIKTLPCMVAISGYWSILYNTKLKDWRSIHFLTGTHGGTVATEWLWMNYPEPMQLHDYKYLGIDYRDREKINRQKKTMRAKLLRMPTVKRYAILSVIADLIEASDRTTQKT